MLCGVGRIKDVCACLAANVGRVVWWFPVDFDMLIGLVIWISFMSPHHQLLRLE